MSVSIENFIKTIYKLELNKTRDTKPGTIAKALGISNPATTDMAQNLAEKKLILYEKYKELKLTSKGKRLALKVLRKHRLWETFLHKTFDLSLHEIHREAELLEHQTSDFLADKLNDYLGSPEIDPHGDPIPDVEGKIPVSEGNILLINATRGKRYIITRLLNSEQEFLDFCNTTKLMVGKVIRVRKKYIKNEMIEVMVFRKKILLNNNIANSIYVKEKEL